MPLKDPVARAEYAAKYRESRREEARERSRKWRNDNPGKVKEMLQSYYIKNREEHIARVREYNKTEAGRQVQRKAWQKAKLNNPEKHKARQLFKAAVYCGKIKRQPCSYPDCKELNAQGHHKDYTKPYDVEWFCRYHHKLIEGKILVPRPEVQPRVEVKTTGV